MPPTAVVVPRPPASPRPPQPPPGSPAKTPPDSSRRHESSQARTIDRFELAVEKLVRALKKEDTRNKTEDSKLEATKHVEAEKPKIRASKLEYKLVDEVWDNGISKYKIVDSAALPEEVTDLDEYMFVVRARIAKGASEQVFYVDIKSNGLRDVLRIILRDVRGLSLGEDKITLQRNLLYHYIPELEAHRTELEGDSHHDVKFKHLNLLVEYMRTAYISTTSRVASLLKNHEITYDLLWALFKPNTPLSALQEAALRIPFHQHLKAGPTHSCWLSLPPKSHGRIPYRPNLANSQATVRALLPSGNLVRLFPVSLVPLCTMAAYRSTQAAAAMVD